MDRRLLLSCWALAFVISGPAEAVEVVVRPAKPHKGEVVDAILTASAVITKNGEETRTVSLAVPGQVTVDLPDGVWRLQVKAPGWFSTGSIATVGRGQTTFVVPIWPLGKVHGKLRTSDDGVIDSLRARWSASVKRPAVVPEGEVPCTVSDHQYSCAIPVGIVDVKLWSKGYGSHFLWQVEVPSAEVAELPLIRLKRGAGVYGWVDAGEGVALDYERARVALTPAMSDRSQRPIVTTVDKRGFFIFRGVDPGSYRIVASAKEAGSEERELVVREGGESELLKPLTLEKRAPLRVSITPSTDPFGSPWQVAVSRARRAYGDSFESRSTTDASGVATISNLAAGPYSVSVTPQGKSTAFVVRSIEMPRDADFVIAIESTKVIGNVQMNGRPLAGAVLWIGGKYHDPSVMLTSGPEGDFSGLVPFKPEETWAVTVSAVTPTIERTIRQRPARQDEAAVYLDLDLPAAMIEGIVLEPGGLPTTKATVNVISADTRDVGLMQAAVDKEGRFELVGLETGSYTVYAEGSGGRTSERSVVRVSDEDTASVKLILGAGLLFSGRLTTENATPVSGARVYVSSVEVPTPVWFPRVTSATGEFQTMLPDLTKTADIFVIAPGFAFKAFRVPVNSDRRLVTLVRQNGGSLTLTTPLTADSSGRIPYIVHQGTALPLMFLLTEHLATSRGSDRTSQLSVAPQMEPGVYGLCLATPNEISSLSQSAQCSFGNLPPFGTLALSIDTPASN